MLWNTLAAVRLTTRLEFTKSLAAQHHFVRLRSGKWTRTLGAPGKDYVNIRGNVWHRREGNDAA